MEPLTQRQQQVLQFIQNCIAEQNTSPTRVEIAEALGFRSPNTAEFHLKALARKGYIKLSAGRNRNIRLSLPERIPAKTQAQTPIMGEQNLTAMPVPLVGQVAAGLPILAQEHIQGYYDVVDLFDKERVDYLLRVKGLSMRDAGILDGDLIAVQKTSQARHGQMIVARLEEEVTVKYFEKTGEKLRLLPANSDFLAIEINPEQTSFTIEGIVIGVLRTRV